MTNPIVKNFVDSALVQLYRNGLMRTPGKLPAEMHDDSIPPSNDWIGWKAVPSTVTDVELNDLERETGHAFPPLYREFLQYRHFEKLTGAGVRFERNLPQSWNRTLRDAFFHSWPRERIVDIGLLPFGSETMMDAGPVCFDTNRRNADGDCPVVFWDHEWIDSDKEIRPMFSSSAKMFECLSLVANHDLNFFHHYGDDDPSLLQVKRVLLNRFLSIDPEGAGGPARDYWTGWGVTPST